MICFVITLILILNSGYLAATASPTVFYLANVFLHTVGGVGLLPLLALILWRFWRWCQAYGSRRQIHIATIGTSLWSIGLLVGVGLIVVGNDRSHRWLLYTHIGLCIAATLCCTVALASQSLQRAFTRHQQLAWRCGVCVIIISVGLPLIWHSIRSWQPNPYQVTNPLLPPMSQDEEGMHGKAGPFHPSGAHTNTGGTIPSNFFMTSERCADCHPDIYQQWSESAHRFSSFNNQWYRKSIEYMQDVVGIRPTRWCAGCHDVALLFNGMMDTPARQLLDTPEAHVGLSCVACHAITKIHDTMGNGDYQITYPALHDLMNSDNRPMTWLHDFLVRVDPAPHRQIFLKPFHRGSQSPAFCSTCHKVHLDTHVNHYRWIRGFNEYDAWQASGVSGNGARSFYYPEQSKTCNDCHMPLVRSADAGNTKGFVHSHRFPGANTALPTVNHHQDQLDITTNFLKSGVVSIDIFAIIPIAPQPQSASPTYIRGRHTEDSIPPQIKPLDTVETIARQTAPHQSVLAPLESINTPIQAGTEMRVEVVVRNREVGHFFPGGTIDSADVWIEFKAVNDQGKVLFWSGAVTDAGKGPVEPHAHRYGSLLVDARGNAINKRNAWAARATVYVHAIPPGAADVVHYRLAVPPQSGTQVTLTAKLHYRKFRWWNTQWAYAGIRDADQPQFAMSPHYDDGKWVFTGNTSRVSGATKSIPNLPIVTLASAKAQLAITAKTHGSHQLKANKAFQKNKLKRSETSPNLRKRWNDYGIGLLLQGDLRGAEHAFKQVIALESEYVDGWVNLGRVRFQDGNLEGAHKALNQALRRDPALPRTHFFLAMVFKAQGNYETALKQLENVTSAHPNDRVVRNQSGRLHFLLGQYDTARTEFEKVLQIDPENLQAHYNLMLSFRALGNNARSDKHRKLYKRFKADESSSVIAGVARRRDPGADTESQPVHEHHSIPLPPASTYTTSKTRPTGVTSQPAGVKPHE